MSFRSGATQAGSLRPTNGGKGQMQLSLRVPAGKREPQSSGCGMRLGAPQAGSWDVSRSTFWSILPKEKPPCPLPGALSQNPPALPTSLPPIPVPCLGRLYRWYSNLCLSVHPPFSLLGSLVQPLGGGWRTGLRTNLGNGDNWWAEDVWLRLHILTLHSTLPPAPPNLHPHSHPQSPWQPLPLCSHPAWVLASHTWP